MKKRQDRQKNNPERAKQGARIAISNRMAELAPMFGKFVPHRKTEQSILQLDPGLARGEDFVVEQAPSPGQRELAPASEVDQNI